jgi:hypothetical protein
LVQAPSLTASLLLTLQESSVEDSPLSLAADQAQATWPTDTNIIYHSGSNNLLFALQGPLLRGVLQDAFEILRATLLLDHAYPDTIVMPLVIRESLLTAAEKQHPRAAVRKRLMDDVEYLTTLIHLVSSVALNIVPLANQSHFQPRSHIPLFWKEIKDCCATMVFAEFLFIGTASAIVAVVDKQLCDYTYVFPFGRTVSASLLAKPH